MSFAFLVTGMGGQLSTDFVEVTRPLPDVPFCRGLTIDDLDITDAFAVTDTVAEWARVVRADSPQHRPVVVNAGLGDMDRLIAAYDCGVVLHERSAEGFEKAAEEIDRLLADEDTPARCRKLAEDHFDVEKGVDELLDLYLQVVGRRTQTAATEPISE